MFRRPASLLLMCCALGACATPEPEPTPVDDREWRDVIDGKLVRLEARMRAAPATLEDAKRKLEGLTLRIEQLKRDLAEGVITEDDPDWKAAQAELADTKAAIDGHAAMVEALQAELDAVKAERAAYLAEEAGGTP